jgi:hypothetical protein
MKKSAINRLDASSLFSNLLLVSAVVAASAPVILGDRLVLIASELVREGSIMLQELSVSLQSLFS